MKDVFLVVKGVADFRLILFPADLLAGTPFNNRTSGLFMFVLVSVPLRNQLSQNTLKHA